MTTTFEFTGLCGTASSAVDEPPLTEPLLRNAQQRPAACCEAPQPSVLASFQGHPGAPVSQVHPAVAAAPPGRAHDSNSTSNSASAAHASPNTPDRTSSEADCSATLTKPAGQNSRDGPHVSGSTPDSQQVLPSKRPQLSQPAKAPGPKRQAPSHAIGPDPPVSNESSQGDDASLAAADKASESSAAELPAAVPLWENSITSADQAVAAADKQPSAASSAGAAAPPASASHRPHSHPEASPRKGAVSKSATRGADDSPAAAAPGGLSGGSADLAAHSKAQAKPSAEEASTADDRSAASGTAAKQRRVTPSAEDAAAANPGPAATGVGAKQSTGDLPSASKDSQAINGSLQTAVASSSRLTCSKLSTAGQDDIASGADESSSAEATAPPGPKASQHDVSGSRKQATSASKRKSPEQELIRQTQQPADGDGDGAGAAKKPQPRSGTVGRTAAQPSGADQLVYLMSPVSAHLKLQRLQQHLPSVEWTN